MKQTKVGYIMGSLVHERNTQIYEGFDPRYKLIMVGSRKCDLGETTIRFEHRRLLSVRDLLRNIPKVRNRVNWMSQQFFYGFDKAFADIDIIYTAGAIMPFSYQSILLKRKTGVKVVLHELENVPYAFMQYGKRRTEERRQILNEVDAIIANTEQVRTCLLMEGVPESKIHVVYFGMRTDLFSPGPKDPGLMQRVGAQPGDRLVTYVADFGWRKGAPTLLFAAKLFDMDPEVNHLPVKFLFVGVRNMAEAQALVNEVGLQNRVILKDRVSYDDLRLLYRSSEIVTLPSIPMPNSYEQGSCVLYESACSGLPIVLSQTGANPEMLGDAGLYHAPADYYGLHDRIKELVTDESMRADYGMRARERALAAFDASTTRKKVAGVFDLVMSK